MNQHDDTIFYPLQARLTFYTVAKGNKLKSAPFLPHDCKTNSIKIVEAKEKHPRSSFSFFKIRFPEEESDSDFFVSLFSVRP